MVESSVIYNASSDNYIDVQGITYALGQEGLSIEDCRKYYPGYVNGVLRDGLGNIHKTPDGFTNNGMPVAFFRGRVLVAIGYVPVLE